MTFNDMLEASVTLQGPTKVTSWFSDVGREKVWYEGDPEHEFGFPAIDEKWADYEIKYIWAASDGLHIEVEEEL